MKMWIFSQTAFIFLGIALAVFPLICNGESCVFPFKYKKKLYYSCITINHNDFLWCGTTADYDKDSKYKNCLGNVREEIICSGDSRKLACNSGTTIRVKDVIYGRVVGRDVCGIKPLSNCTEDILCDVSEKSNKKRYSPKFSPDTPNKFGVGDPCSNGAEYIVIKYVCEQVAGSPGNLDGENFALKKPASQSSTYVSNDNTNQPASYAVDGNHKNNWQVCTHTRLDVTNPWWRVDLEQRVAVSHVRITNRNNLGERLNGFEIRIGDTAAKNGTQNARCGKPRRIPSNKAAVISCDPPLVGRYVTIVIPGDRKILTLCEVEVYGTSVLGRENLAGAQLVGSNLPYEGQVVLNGSTFCDPQWSHHDANTICLQLGYPRANITNWNHSHFASSVIFSRNSPVVKDFNCTGAESSLYECPQTVENGTSCTAEKAVTVSCQTFVRLRGSDIPAEGRVEVFHMGVWGTVSDENQCTTENGIVVCQELGFYNVTRQFRSTYDSGRGKVCLKNLQCVGDEKSLVFCNHSNWENNTCSHNQDIAVECSVCAQPLLKDRKKFPDSIFNASAYRSPDYSPSSSRLYSPRSWCLTDDYLNQDQFLEINLPGIFSLSAVVTVGGSLGYVTSYKLSYSVNETDWLFAVVDKNKIIPGNTNNDTYNVIRREFDRTFYAQKVRMIPVSWFGVPCMRLELCGKEIPLCNPPNITVEKITSTSVKIRWESLIIPGKYSPHNNYSVTLIGENHVFHTGDTFAALKVLCPFKNYSLIVLAAGLMDCFQNNAPITFRTEEDVPGAPPKKVRVKMIGSKSFSVTWSPPDAKNQNGIITNYSICYSIDINKENCSNDNVSMLWTKTTSIRIENLQMDTVYYIWIRAYTRKGPGPYTNRKKITTKSVPGAPPKAVRVKEVGSNSFTVTWSPPDVKKQNGIITNYSICYSIDINKEKCSSVDNSVQWTKATSQRIENLQMATIYYFWIRAYTKDGPGPYTNRTKIVTSSGALQKPNNIASDSFQLHLQVPKNGFSYIQIIVIRLNDSTKPKRSPYSYTEDKIGTDNKPVSFLKPYVTAKLQAAEVRQNEYFTVGDGKSYPQSRKRRRRDEVSDTPSFFNRPLESDSFYSAFQRTYQDEGTYYSSFWMETIKTNKIGPENAVQSEDKGMGTWIGTGVGVAVLVIFLLLVCLLILKKRRSKLKNADEGTTIGNIAAKRGPNSAYERADHDSGIIAMVKLDGGGVPDSKSDAKEIYENPNVHYENLTKRHGGEFSHDYQEPDNEPGIYQDLGYAEAEDDHVYQPLQHNRMLQPTSEQVDRSVLAVDVRDKNSNNWHQQDYSPDYEFPDNKASNYEELSSAREEDDHTYQSLQSDRM